MGEQKLTRYGELWMKVVTQIGRDDVLRALGSNRTQRFDRDPFNPKWRLSTDELSKLHEISRQASAVVRADWERLVVATECDPADYPLPKPPGSPGIARIYSHLRLEAPPSAWSRRRNVLFKGDTGNRPSEILGMYNHIPALFRTPRLAARPVDRPEPAEEYTRQAEAYRSALREERTAIQDAMRQGGTTHVRHLYSLPALGALVAEDPLIRDEINRLIREADGHNNFTVRAVRHERFPLEFTIVNPAEVVLIEVPQVLPTQRTTRSVNGIEIEGTSAVIEFIVQFETVWGEALQQPETVAELKKLISEDSSLP